MTGDETLEYFNEPKRKLKKIWTTVSTNQPRIAGTISVKWVFMQYSLHPLSRHSKSFN